jgi:myo-inositol-1(or 4)-monophosphatase
MIHTSHLLEIAVTTAREAGKFLRQSIGKVGSVETKESQERNLVSDIDKQSEELIIGMIRKHFPDHAILAEEGGKGRETSDYKWVIDPLDGTTNFLHNLPIYCVTIGVEYEGEVIAGAVYDPNLEELFTAERGTGAFLNGSRISVSRTTRLVDSLLVTGFPYDIATNPDHAIERFVALLKAARGIRRLGSAALDLCYVAAGRFDGFWEVNLHPWDMAAGLLVVNEAGGKATDFEGGLASIYKRQIVASNGAIHEAILRMLQQPEGDPSSFS